MHVMFFYPIGSTKCCGSSFPTEVAFDAGPLKRVVAHESVYIESSDNTVFPPRRIIDLRVDKVMILKGKLAYVLNWTAPGNDYDYGTGINLDVTVNFIFHLCYCL